MKPPYTKDGTTGFINEFGARVCTGSQMGRRNIIPDDYNGERLHLHRLKWHDGGYDQGGAYWGRNGCNHVYCAFGETETEQMQVYVRAMNRQEAKSRVADAIVLRSLATPKFYR